MTEDLNNQDFWTDLEQNDGKIIKWNERGEYNKLFTPDYKKMLDCYQNLPDSPEIRLGDVVNGTVSKLSKRELVIDVSFKDSVYVDVKGSELSILKDLKIGDNLEVMVTEINNKPYEIKGSISELLKSNALEVLKKSFYENLVLIANVKELTPSGFLLDIIVDDMKFSAFMPNTLAGVNRLTLEQSEYLVGNHIYVMLETLQQEKGVYVVSRRKYLKSLMIEEIETLRKEKETNPEKVYSGTVTGTKDFGIFVEFNECLTGMIHKANVHPDWQNRINEIKSGTSIEFYIKEVQKDGKLILTQILKDSLWDHIRVGQIYESTVISVKNGGVLVALDDETLGVVNKSNYDRYGKTLDKGDKVKLKVIFVVRDDRKIFLDFTE